MTEDFDLRRHDALFASRCTAAEWERIRAFRDQPNFMAGPRRHEGTMRPFFAHNLILNKVVTEAWRFQILVFTLYLDSVRDPSVPRSGLTVANLQRICTQLQLASPGRVYAFLNVMKFGGYLSAQRSTSDSRLVHLTPTPRFLEIVEEWNDNIFASIDAASGSDLVGDKARFPDLGREMRTRGAEGLLAGWLPLDPFPEVFHFASTDGGWLLMEHIVLRSITGDQQLQRGPVQLSIRSLAKQFSGSRSNLLRLLDRAYEMDLLDEPPGVNGLVRPSSRLCCAFLTFMASFLGFFEMHTKAALAARTPELLACD